MSVIWKERIFFSRLFQGKRKKSEWRILVQKIRGSNETLTGLMSLDFFPSRGRTKFYARQTAQRDTKRYYLTLMKIIFDNTVHTLTTAGSYFEITSLFFFEYLNRIIEVKL